MKRFPIPLTPTIALTFAATLGFSIIQVNGERLLDESFEVANSSGDPVGWQTAGHPSYLGVAQETGIWSTPYGERAMTTYSTGVGTKTIGFLPFDDAPSGGSGDYTASFNISSSATKGEYRAELWAVPFVGSPILLAYTEGDTDGSKNFSFSDNMSWRYEYDDWVDEFYGYSTIAGAELKLKLMQDPNRSDWRNTPLWDNVTADYEPDVDYVGPTLVDISDDNEGGTVVPTGSTVIYTVAFNEAMDASTVTVGDFGNAGSAAMTVNSVTATPDDAIFLVSVTPTGGGTLRLKIVEDSDLEDMVGNLMDTSGDLIQDDVTFTVESGTPTLLPSDIVDDRGGSPAPENTLITFTLTFSKDMNAATLTSADLGNAGTAPISVGTITETTDGVFTVEVSPTGSGTLQFGIKAGVEVKAADGGTLNTSSAISDDTTILVDSVPPLLTNITDDAEGNSVAVGTPITYDVFFDEAMDVSTVTAADFGNAISVGNATFTINSVEEASPGVFRIEVMPTGSGSIELQINEGADLRDVIGNPLDTTPAIVDDTIITVDGVAPTLAGADIVDDQGGAPVAPDALVSYTLTFSEDMDETTVTADDFGNAGSAPITIGAISEISPGVFTIEVTPTGEGTLRLRVNASAVLMDLAGNSVDTTTPILDDTIITVSAPVTDPFVAWSAGSSFGDDTNGDGVKNGLAWVLGALDPDDNATGLLPTVSTTSDPNYLTFTFRRKDEANGDPNTTIQVEYGTTLSPLGWTAAVHDNDNVIITETDNHYSITPGIDRVVVKLKRSTLSSGGKLFVRMNVLNGP